MDYNFPQITHINDVLPAIEGRDEFIVVQKDGYQVVNYAVMMEDSFPPIESELDALRRECRGLVFDLEGKLINRRFHKFFNVNERDETRLENVDLSVKHHILEKLDGSMVSPCIVNGHVRWMTKMGITDTSMEAEVYVAKNPQYATVAKSCLDSDTTPVFEWCSNKNRIVLSYPEDQLVLTAIRDNRTGNYAGHEYLQRVGFENNIPVVKAYSYDSANIVDIVRAMEDAEGVVIRFFTGHMLKVKADWYVLRHKSKDAITREKNVLDYMVNEHVDDVLPFLQAEDQSRLLQFQDKFWAGFNESLATYEDHYQNVVAAGVDRKQYALEWKPVIERTFPFAPQYVFGRMNGREGRDMLLGHISKNIGTQTRINETRTLWGGYEWNYIFDGDE
jgi:RNA ligase